MSQKLLRSLARPFKIELALNPVVRGLEKGAETESLRVLFGGEAGVQSRRTAARIVQRTFVRLLGFYLAVFGGLQLDVGLTDLRSVIRAR